jgi:hypothetical protein
VNTHIIGRHTAGAVAAALLAGGAAIGLTACQIEAAPAAPGPVEQTVPRWSDRSLIDRYGGRPVDRIAEEIERAIQDGQLPSPRCTRHHVVEHPDGGYHLVCVQPGE